MRREIPGDVKVTVKVDEVSTTLTVMDGSMVKLQRNVNHGLADAIEAIQDSELFGEYLSFTDAVDVARRKTCLAISLMAQYLMSRRAAAWILWGMRLILSALRSFA